MPVPFPNRFSPATAVDVGVIKDSATGLRMNRDDGIEWVQTTVPCYVQHIGSEMASVADRESIRHEYLIFFYGRSPVALTAAHRLRWIDPDTEQTWILEVRGCKRRRYENFADRVTAIRYESGVTT